MWRNKYDLYENSVQSPQSDVLFIDKEYIKIYGRPALSLREDFCGTGALLKEWVEANGLKTALGIDLDPDPIQYGKKHHWSNLEVGQQRRVQYINKNVIKAYSYKADVICAFNYSYCVFRERKVLLNYFKGVRKALNKKGLFFLDTFGGTESMMENVESRNLGDFTYYWECEKFNPLTHECFYSIHFKKKGSQKIHKRVFTYHWRFWSISELKDLLVEAGFSRIKSYWEGDGTDGKGNGKFKESDKAENCLSWISYLVAIP